MKKTKLAGIVLWLLGICLYFYPDVATDLQEIKVQAFVKTYEREHKSRRRSVTGSRQEEYGYIQIPKMNVTLPLYRNETEEHLAWGAAILKESGLPEEKGQNCIIAAHRGYRGKPYFRDIEKLEYGDVIYVRTPEQKLEYRVQDMDIIRLEETQKIKKEKDMLTLLTCHPYRGNGKFRYLVYSVRKRRKEGDRSMTECRKIQKTQDVRLEQHFRKICGIILLILLLTGIWGMSAKAARHSLSKKIDTSSHIVTCQWKSNAKFNTGKGLQYIRENACVLLHYMDGELGQCVYAEQDTPVGPAKEFDVTKDSRTSWMYERKNGYEKYKYIGIAQEYLLSGKVTLRGITGSSKLMKLPKSKRQMLAQGFSWYMQHASYNRTEGKTVKLISQVPDFGASKQIILYDQLYTEAKNILGDYTITEKTYKLERDGNTHQPIAVFKIVTNPKPVIKNVERKGAGESSQKVSLRIDKRDIRTERALEGAVFQLSCDGKAIVDVITDADGKAQYIYERLLKTKTYTVSKKYVSNWDDLDKKKKSEATENGYYQNKSLAEKAAKREINKKVQAELASLQSKFHLWNIKEIKAPFGHRISDADGVMLTEQTEKDLKVQLWNYPEDRELKLEKISAEKEESAETSLADAIYGLYAETEIMDSDNKRVLYVPGEEVTELCTNQKGQANAGGLRPGKYYLREKEAPRGFLLDDTAYPVDLRTEDQKITVQDAMIRGKIRIHKTCGRQDGTDSMPEEGAAFVLYDSQGRKVETLLTDLEGKAESGWLPYGHYRLEQIQGIGGYSFLAPQTVAVTRNQKIYEIKGHDMPAYAGIAISKVKKLFDAETGMNECEAEKGAEFEILDASGKKVESLVTDENGTAYSQEMEPGIYTIHQSKGAENYKKIPDFKVTIKSGEERLLSYYLEDESTAQKIRIRKTKEKDGKETPEAGAEFEVLNEKKEKMQTLVTDEKGEACALLDMLSSGESFFVRQTKGAEGYSFAEIFDSSKETPVEEDGHLVYTFKAKDVFEDYAFIHIKKMMVTDRPSKTETVTQPEAGARFEIRNEQGKAVETLTTDEKGEAVSGKLAFGTYMIHQIEGVSTHRFSEDRKVILGKEQKGKTEVITIINEENLISFELTKRSAETGKLLNDATYLVLDEKGETVARFTTGQGEETEKQGAGMCRLPYGHYTLKEIVSPDGYKCSQKKEFTITFKDAPDGIMKMEDQDVPVRGKIQMTKMGDRLHGFSQGQFQYRTGQVAGAVYGLYAKEDICLDDDSVLWKTGTLIDKKRTDESGNIKFTRKQADGTKTELFPLGIYEVRELEAPYGYRKDEEIYEVRLTWDENAKKENKVTSPDVPDNNTDESLPVTYPEASKGRYILKSGREFRRILHSVEDKLDTITFTNEKAPEGASYKDVSSLEDGSVVMWMEDQNCMISTQTEEQDVILNADSSAVFRQLVMLEKIYFDAIETSSVINANDMFSRCTKLKELDLTRFYTKNMKYVKNMFRNCTSLEKIYANTRIENEETEGSPVPVKADVSPKYDFTVGSVYKTEDFNFQLVYSDGSRKEVYPSDEEVQILPQKAEKEGKETVGFVFIKGSLADYPKAETIVQVVDVIDADRQEVKDVDFRLEAEDTLLTQTIEIGKEDESGTPVEGALFGMYAGREIRNADGEILFRKGERIMEAQSESTGEGTSSKVMFSGLPSDLYSSGADGLYEVREIRSAPGYKIEKGTKNSWSFDGEPKENSRTVTVSNRKLEHAELVKIWDDNRNAAGKRPSEILISAKKDGTEKTYTLSKENDWRLETDILVAEMKEWELCEEVPEGYESDGMITDEKKGVWTVTNKIKDRRCNLQVEKKWEDEDNLDGIRPDKVKVYLYQNGIPYRETILQEENNWKDEKSFEDLPAEDEKGRAYVYEFREEQTELIDGNKETGYLPLYTEEETEEENRSFLKTTITNQHVPEKGKIIIFKKIKKDEIDWEKWRPEFSFTLHGKTLLGEEINQQGILSFTKEEVRYLLEETDGYITKSLEFTDLQPGTYTVREEQTDPYYRLSQISCTDEGVKIDETNQEITWRIGRDGQSQGRRTLEGHAVFENRARTGKIQIMKTDEHGNALAGVLFGIYDANGKQVAVSTSGKDGKLAFSGLKTGQYEIKELQTVYGKSKLTKPISVTIPLVLKKEEAEKEGADVEKAVVFRDSCYYYDLSYQISNSAVLELPETGAHIGYGLLLAGMACMSMGMYAGRKRRKGKYAGKG